MPPPPPLPLVPQGYEGWLAAHGEGVAAFRAAAAGLGLDPEPFLSYMHAAGAAHLLSPVADGQPRGGGGGAGRQLEAEAGLAAAQALLASLGVPPAAQPQLLAACPHLMARRPGPGALAALQQLVGGREQLCAAVLRSPRLLALSPSFVERRLALLALHLHSAEAAAAALAMHPALLSVNDRTLNANARHAACRRCPRLSPAPAWPASPRAGFQLSAHTAPGRGHTSALDPPPPHQARASPRRPSLHRSAQVPGLAAAAAPLRHAGAALPSPAGGAAGAHAARAAPARPR